MHINAELKKSYLQNLIFIILICFFYGLMIASDNIVLNNMCSAGFVTFLMCLSFKTYKIMEVDDNQKSFLIYLLTITAAINLFIILGTALAHPAQSYFWVADSYEMHIPGSVRIMEILKGNSGGFTRSSIYDRTYIAHLMGSIFFLIFGVNHIASALSLIIPKVICVYFIFKGTQKLLDDQSAKIAAILYAFLPTAIFYTTTFYKEAPLQMLMAGIYYLIIKSFYEFKTKYVLSLVVLFAFLGNERHYLLPCFAISIILFAFLSKKVNLYSKIFIFLIFVIGYFIFTSYYWDINLSSAYAQLKKFREIYTSYPDIHAINRDLPYPLGVIKLLFSPYITTIKLQTYTHLATIITWGSIPHQLLMLFFGIGSFRILKEKNQLKLMLILVVPFIIFMMVFGYVAPYNGRLRDSFLPLIVMIGSYGVKFLIDRLTKRISF